MAPVQLSELNLQGYSLVSNLDKNYRRGVCIYVRNSIGFAEIDIGDFEAEESVWIEVKLRENDKLLVGCVYRSPNSSEENNLKLTKTMKHAVELKHSHMLVMGDFNHPEIDWKHHTTPSDINHPASVFMECVRDCFLTQHVTEPTHHRAQQRANTLDLIMTNEENMIDHITYLPPVGKSHHSCLQFLFKCYQPGQYSSAEKLKFDKGDYDSMRRELQGVDWEAELEDKSTEDAWVFIRSRLDDVMKKYIPRKTQSVTNVKHKPLWLNESVINKLKKKKFAYTRYLQTKEGKDYNEYAKARNQAKWEVRKAKICFEKAIAKESKANPKSFYRYLNSKMKTKPGIGNLHKTDGKIAQSDKEKAEELNNFFSSVFTRENTENVPSINSHATATIIDSIVVKEEAVKTKLQKLKPSKSPGPDRMHPRVLKELSEELATPLTLLFNKSLHENKLPVEWKDAQITPIHKKGKKSETGNYRPVSLTSVVCKILESFVREAVLDHMKEILHGCQHGFIKKRSCATQLLEVLDYWTSILDDGYALDVIYLDFAKAFDSVPHARLLSKLESYGIKGDILNWIADFLTNRRQRVVVNGSFSSWAPVLSGVPQGSVLGPVLFVCYVNDIADCVHNMVAMYADDTKIFSKIEAKGDNEKLQIDLSNLEEWSRTWQLRFNASKCKVMHFGRQNPCHQYLMNETDQQVQVEESCCEKDLGVLIDNQLKFNKQIEAAVSKANSKLGMIRRSFEHLDGDMLIQLYKSVVRPHLEYCNSVWSPVYKKDVQLLEGVQRRATKLVPGMKDMEYADRLEALKLPSLVYRRLRGDLIEAFKFKNHMYAVNSDTLLPLEKESRTRGNSQKLKKQRFNTTIRKQFFSLRVTDYWNGLSDDIITSKSLNIFKNRIDKLYEDSKYSIEFPIPPKIVSRSTV